MKSLPLLFLTAASVIASARYLCLESEGSPIDFKDIKLKKVPAT